MSEKDPHRGEEGRDEEIDKMENLEDHAQAAPSDEKEEPAGPSIATAFGSGS